MLLGTAALADVRGPARVVDGDSLHVAGVSVRLHGIDAPEMAQTCAAPQGDWPCGRWAQQVLDGYIDAPVTCVGIETDRYGRLVAKCDAGQGDLGALMVLAGAAIAYRRYSHDYVPHEARAAAAQRGIWRQHGKGLVDPAEFRAARRAGSPATQALAPVGCAIKGNISGNGRIYHRPGQRDYDRTRIDPSRGERWFCSEQEARAAGWRAARR